MSMVLCHYCEAFIDSDEHPEGFYVKNHADNYVCQTCVENEDLEYDE